MGAIGEALLAYAEPLLEQTDGSSEDWSKALMIAQLCYNLAILPMEDQEAGIAELQPHFGMNDEDFARFRDDIIWPMIWRHREMFPRLHQRGSAASPPPPSATETRAGPSRNARCPCGSGKRYKRCCGKK